MPTIKEIIKDYLEKNGYDGLFNGNIPCGCLKDDLNPCGEPFDECLPGYRGACSGDCDSGKCPWHIYRDKATALAADEAAGPAETEEQP